MSSTRLSLRLAVVFCAIAAATPLGQRSVAGVDHRGGHVISGRVVDPHQLRPESASLLLWERIEEMSFSGDPIPVAPDGSFRTPPRRPGLYVLELQRTPHSATTAAQVVGLTTVPVGPTDMSGVTVEVRRDTALTGRFRMESDNPKAEWPSEMMVFSFLAIDGESQWPFMAAEGGPGGTFVLRNAFGPRVLRFNYRAVPGSMWWPSKVILDGKDVTNVPTDFSEHPDGRLEVVFTQHPARIAGTVTDAQGRPVHMAWVTVRGSDRASSQLWATTSDVTQADEMGRFTIVVPPGTYRVNALPPGSFASRYAAREGMSRIAFGGVAVTLGERERKVVPVTLQAR
jgi:hypothetical protein